MKTFPTDMTADQIDRGEGMTFHPAERSLSVYRIDAKGYLKFDPEAGAFYIPGGGCAGRYVLPKIGDGQDKKAGDPYPSHWIRDPYTGRIMIPFPYQF